jgi:hypothetical protein
MPFLWRSPKVLALGLLTAAAAHAQTPWPPTFGAGAGAHRQGSAGRLLHTICVGVLCDDDQPFSLHGRPPGASSAQQLQVVQEKTELWWGPLPLTLTSGIDFFNGEAPFFWVVNPNNAPNKIRVDLVLFDRVTGLSTPVAWRSLQLPPFGTLLEKSGPHLTGPPGLWDHFQSLYTTLGTGDFDVLVHVTSDSGLPILGDGVMTDFQGNGGKRFRMVSHMLANTPSSLLLDPDFSEAPGGIIQTYIGLMNGGTAARSSASSSGSSAPPPPRLAARWARAWSISSRRITWAAAPRSPAMQCPASRRSSS